MTDDTPYRVMGGNLMQGEAGPPQGALLDRAGGLDGPEVAGGVAGGPRDRAGFADQELLAVGVLDRSASSWWGTEWGTGGLAAWCVGAGWVQAGLSRGHVPPRTRTGRTGYGPTCSAVSARPCSCKRAISCRYCRSVDRTGRFTANDDLLRVHPRVLGGVLREQLLLPILPREKEPDNRGATQHHQQTHHVGQFVAMEEGRLGRRNDGIRVFRVPLRDVRGAAERLQQLAARGLTDLLRSGSSSDDGREGGSVPGGQQGTRHGLHHRAAEIPLQVGGSGCHASPGHRH